VAVVVDHQLDRAAQVPLGGRIRFRWAPGYDWPLGLSGTSPNVSQKK
jgi:hypothetical protein